MKCFHVSLVLSFLVLFIIYNVQCERLLSRKKRIINGQNEFNHDYVVSLFGRDSIIHGLLTGSIRAYYCGGALIEDQWIITAAHCFKNNDDLLNPNRWHVRFDKDLSPSTYERLSNAVVRMFNLFSPKILPQSYYHLKEVHIHPEYDSRFLENDIALLRIKEKLDFINKHEIESISLPPDDGQIYPVVNDTCMALGWGCNSVNGPPNEILKSIKIPVVSHEECLKMYNVHSQINEKSEFCAGKYRANIGICKGDSGGPLVCQGKNRRAYIGGVTSASSSQFPQDYPGIFTRVSHFIPWIRQVIRNAKYN